MNRSKGLILFLIAMAFVFVGVCPAVADIYAEGVDPTDPATLEEYSSVVARGVVTSIVVAEGEYGIHTDYTFEIIEEIKGDVPETITVRCVGGRIGEIVLSSVEGYISLVEGERVKLFLIERPDGLYEVTFDPHGVITETGISAQYVIWYKGWPATDMPLEVRVNVSDSYPAQITAERWVEICQAGRSRMGRHLRFLLRLWWDHHHQ